MADAECLLQDGVFELQHIRLVYTPQCLALVQLARSERPSDADDSAAEALEERAAQEHAAKVAAEAQQAAQQPTAQGFVQPTAQGFVQPPLIGPPAPLVGRRLAAAPPGGEF